MLEGGSDTPRLDTELLLAHCLQATRTTLFTWPERSLSAEQEEHFVAAMQRRRKGEPVAYILGRRDFWSLSLEVNDSTLIPRPDTELLIEVALELLPSEFQKVLDLGTGTGAIGLALAHERREWQVTATDRSAGAVALAERNRHQLGLANVHIVQSDWFEQLEVVDYDLVVSNPPYIDASDEHLNRGDVAFEPRSALVADRQGLADIEAIALGLASRSERSCWLLVEHGWQQGEAVRATLAKAGYGAVETRRDLAGHERCTFARWLV